MLTLYQALKTFGYIKGEYFNYNFPKVSNLAAGSDAQESVTVDNDFHFIITNLFGVGLLTSDGVSRRDFLIQFQDTSTSKFFSTSPVNSLTYISNADSVAPQPIERLVPKRTTITMRVTNNIQSPGDPLDIYVTLRGYKLYPKGWNLSYLKRSGVLTKAATPLASQATDAMNIGDG